MGEHEAKCSLAGLGGAPTARGASLPPLLKAAFVQLRPERAPVSLTLDAPAYLSSAAAAAAARAGEKKKKKKASAAELARRKEALPTSTALPSPEGASKRQAEKPQAALEVPTLGLSSTSKPLATGRQPSSGVANGPGWESARWEGHPAFARAESCPSNICQGLAGLLGFTKESSTLTGQPQEFTPGMDELCNPKPHLRSFPSSLSSYGCSGLDLSWKFSDQIHPGLVRGGGRDRTRIVLDNQDVAACTCDPSTL